MGLGRYRNLDEKRGSLYTFSRPRLSLHGLRDFDKFSRKSTRHTPAHLCHISYGRLHLLDPTSVRGRSIAIWTSTDGTNSGMRLTMGGLESGITRLRYRWLSLYREPPGSWHLLNSVKRKHGRKLSFQPSTLQLQHRYDACTTRQVENHVAQVFAVICLS